MDAISGLTLGFGNALTLANLGWALLGCFLGTAIGVLPGIGPALTIALAVALSASLTTTTATAATLLRTVTLTGWALLTPGWCFGCIGGRGYRG